MEIACPFIRAAKRFATVDFPLPDGPASPTMKTFPCIEILPIVPNIGSRIFIRKRWGVTLGLGAPLHNGQWRNRCEIALETQGILRLRNCFAKRSNSSAQDDRGVRSVWFECAARATSKHSQFHHCHPERSASSKAKTRAVEGSLSPHYGECSSARIFEASSPNELLDCGSFTLAGGLRRVGSTDSVAMGLWRGGS